MSCGQAEEFVVSRPTDTVGEAEPMRTDLVKFGQMTAVSSWLGKSTLIRTQGIFYDILGGERLLACMSGRKNRIVSRW